MITITDYYDIIRTLDVNSLPQHLQVGHAYLNKATADGQTWEAYEQSEVVRRVIDVYFGKLAAYLSKEKKEAEPAIRSLPKKIVEKRNAVPKPSQVKTKSGTELVERIPDEIRFIKRYVNMDGKIKTKEQVLAFVNALQKAILEKRIRKTSAYAKEIRYIQDALIRHFYQMPKKSVLRIEEHIAEQLRGVAAKEQVIASIPLIKRYISLNGKPGMKQKGAALLQQIINAQEKGKILPDDPYFTVLSNIKKHLQSFLTDGKVKSLSIEKNELNGLQGILDNQSLHGLPEHDSGQSDGPTIMNSMELADMNFETLGLKGKWLELIGDPSPGFTAMVFGKPKFGKSYLCVAFAGYLARNHGTVLYVAKEEGIDKTLQMKLRQKDVAHPNLAVADGLPDDLSAYDFIFLDSVNDLHLSADDLKALEQHNPGKSFIYVFQSVKSGNFRGNNTFQHNVDIVINVPERGKAVQFGRFNQGGQMGIFTGRPEAI